MAGKGRRNGRLQTNQPTQNNPNANSHRFHFNLYLERRKEQGSTGGHGKEAARALLCRQPGGRWPECTGAHPCQGVVLGCKELGDCAQEPRARSCEEMERVRCSRFGSCDWMEVRTAGELLSARDRSLSVPMDLKSVSSFLHSKPLGDPELNPFQSLFLY